MYTTTDLGSERGPCNLDEVVSGVLLDGHGVQDL